MTTIYLSTGRIDYTPKKLGKTGRAKRVISTRAQKDAIFHELITLGERLNKTERNNAKRNADYKAKRLAKK